MKVVLSEHNVEHRAERMIARSWWPLVYLVERHAVRKADAVIALSREDARELAHDFRRQDVVIIPVGIEISRFTPKWLPSAGDTNSNLPWAKPRLVFHGDFNHVPNRRALERIVSTVLPRVSALVPGTELVAFGRGLAKQTDAGLRYLGFVPDVLEILQGCDVAVVPVLEGGGVKVKILEYLACGIPVVTTNLGNRGLGLTDSVNAFISDDIEGAFSSAVVALLRDNDLRKRIGSQGREHVISHFALNHVNTLFLEAIQKVAR